MSILLDALKKSDGARQPGGTRLTKSETSRSASNLFHQGKWLPITMLALSAITMAWIGSQQFQKPSELAISKSPVSGDIRTLSRGTESRTLQHSEIKSPLQRTPEETGSAPVESESAQPLDMGPEVSPSSAETRQNGGQLASESKPVSPPQSWLMLEKCEPPKFGASNESENSAEDTATNNLNSSVNLGMCVFKYGEYRRLIVEYIPPPTKSVESPDFISYWELPQSLRDKMPSLKITVLVYAIKKEERFVFINGERWVERDRLEPGLILQEIRPDGVVFSYRNQKFMVKA
jgi:hypothetical protein